MIAGKFAPGSASAFLAAGRFERQEPHSRTALWADLRDLPGKSGRLPQKLLAVSFPQEGPLPVVNRRAWRLDGGNGGGAPIPKKGGRVGLK